MSPDVRRLVQRIVAHWRQALAVADQATEEAFAAKALGKTELQEAHQRLRAERDWLARFELDLSTRFP
jgi:hypothetical protein